MPWEELEVSASFGQGEETQRFGPRQETGSSLYQVDTYVSITNKSEDIGSPWIFSSACMEKVVIIVEKHAIVFNDSSCSKHSCTFTADACIDAVSLSKDGSFLVFADRSGAVSVALTDSKSVLFSKHLIRDHDDEEEKCFASLMLQKVTDDLYDIIIITTGCKGFLLGGVDLGKISTASANQNDVKEILSLTKNSIFNLDEVHTVVHSATLYHDNEYDGNLLLVTGNGEEAFSKWSLEEDGVELYDCGSHILPDIGFKKCMVTANGYIVALDTLNQITLWSVQTFTLLATWTKSGVEDFSLFLANSVEDQSECKEDLKLVMLTSATDGKRDLVVLEVPHFKHVYTLKVPFCASLTSLPIEQEVIMFLVGDEETDYDGNALVRKLHLKCLIEALPENRLSRLLFSMKFDDAVVFADMYQLDVQMVHKVKCSHILKQLMPPTNGVPMKEEVYAPLMADLKSTLDKIKDLESIVNLCLRAELPSLNATLDLLNYAIETAKFDTREFVNSSHLLQELIQANNRSITFQKAFAAKEFSGAQWTAFLKCSLIEEVIKWFRARCIDTGFIIWSRHKIEFKEEFGFEHLKMILNAIPENILPDKIIPWLREEFVPFVLTNFPDGQEILAEWFEKSARALEFSPSTKSQWPDNALEMAEVTYTAFSSVSETTEDRGVGTPAEIATKVCMLTIPIVVDLVDDATISDQGDKEQPISAMKKLGNLVKSLREVTSLHHDYNCKLSLDQFKTEDTTSIAFYLLDRIVAAELIPETVRKFVKPYILKNNLKVDDLLNAYISKQVAHKTHAFSLWELKAIAIIKEIHKKELRCEATINLMEKAKTPWSEEVEHLVAGEIKANPDNIRLLRQFEFAKLRKMMMGYGVKDVNLADLSRIIDIVSIIIRSNHPSSLKDAFKIAQHFEFISTASVYFEQIKDWFEKSKRLEAIDLARKIPTEHVEEVIYSLIGWLKCTLVHEACDEEQAQEQIKLTEFVIVITSTAIKKDSMLTAQYGEEIRILKNISHLQREFAVFISYEEYTDEDFRINMIRTFSKNAESPPKRASESEKENWKNVSPASELSFAHLLGYEDADYYEVFVNMYKDGKQWPKLYCLICDLANSIGGSCSRKRCIELLFKSLYTLITADLPDFDWMKVADSLYACACKALLFKYEDNTCDYVLLTKYLRNVSLLASQCASPDYQEDSKRMSCFNPKWIEDHYKDDSMVLSPEDVFPLLQQMIKQAFPDYSGCLQKYETNCLCGKLDSGKDDADDKDESSSTMYAIVEFVKVSDNLVTILENNKHRELALQILMSTVLYCFQRVAVVRLSLEYPDNDDSTEVNNSREDENMQLGAIILEIEKRIKQFFTTIFQSILSYRVIDHHLAMSYLDVFTKAEGVNLLGNIMNKFKSKYARLQMISKVGTELAALRNDLQMKEEWEIKKECSFWGRKMQLLRVPTPWNIFIVPHNQEEKKRILTLLVAQKNIDLQSIVSYCRAFSFDEEEAMLLYIEYCLVPPEGHSENTLDTSYQEKIDSCDLSVYQDIKKLEIMLFRVLRKISDYDYERLSYVFKKVASVTEEEEIKLVAEENVILLEMLATYTRTATNISLVDIDSFDEEQLYSSKSAFSSEIAKTRLPFHAIANKDKTWLVIYPELTSVANVIALKPIAQKLKIDADHMFAKAIQTIAAKEIEKSKIRENNQECPLKLNLVEEIFDMIDAHFIMISTAKWLVPHLPKGADKVRLFEMINERIEKLFESTIEEADIERIQVMKKNFSEYYKRASIEAALIDHGINDPKYFKLCGGAAKLIITLYEDYGDKVRYDTGKMTDAPEIHKLAQRIEEINGKLDLASVHTHLFNKWLPALRGSTNEVDTDADVSLLTSNQESIRIENEKNLHRVIYVLAGCCTQETIITILKSIFHEENPERMTHVCRIRALRVLFSLVDIHTIDSVSSFTSAQIREKFIACMYLSEMEKLHISYSEESFRCANKENIVKGLWRNYSHKPQGIRLISDLCLDYHIFDPQLWNSLLSKLLSFEMIPYLTHILSILAGIPRLQEIPSLLKVWRAVINAPFESVSLPLSNEDRKACIHSYQLLARCPVILAIGLTDIADSMKKVGLYLQSLLTLQLVPDRKLSKKLIHGIFDEVGADVLLEKVKSEAVQGIIDPNLDALEEEIYAYIEEHGLFLKLYGTVYFNDLIKYLVRIGKIDKILMKTIQMGRTSDAAGLLKMYILAHPQDEWVSQLLEDEEPSDTLIMYLDRHGLYKEAKPYLGRSLNGDTSHSLS